MTLKGLENLSSDEEAADLIDEMEHTGKQPEKELPEKEQPEEEQLPKAPLTWREDV